MQLIRQKIRTMLLYAFSVVLVASSPLGAFAQEAPVSSTTTPTNTESPAPAPPKPTYTYDETNKRWNTDEWKYDPATNTYVPIVKQTTAPATSAEQPTEEKTAETSSQTTSPTESAAKLSESSGTGVDDQKDGEIKDEQIAKSDKDVSTNVEVNNGIGADSLSGDAGVLGNTKAGNAGTGDAEATTTVVNIVQSSVEGAPLGVARFTSNIEGDVVGDITLYPTLQSTLANTATQSSGSLQVDASVKLANDIALNANSGDATVSGNTNAGSATSGNADAVANVVNLINSIVAANQSFIGTINIYGNLNGDILVSPEFIPQLLASNASTKTTDSQQIDVDNNTRIVNDVVLNAVSGDATVEKNTNAGSAKTGTAQTNLTVLNLTGHEVVAANSLLVFVNVLGKWVGMIVDAPAGTTAAALGNGVTTNNLNSLGSQVAIDNDTQIANTIRLNAASGDATVSGNTNAGDAISGNATASANILNMDMSTFSITDWFGILFINVFGSWYGSFGIDTANGNVVVLDGGSTKLGGGTTLALSISRKEKPAPISSALAYKPSGAGGVISPASLPTDAQMILATAMNGMGNTKEEYKLVPVGSTVDERQTSPVAYALMAGGFLTMLTPALAGAIKRRRASLAPKL